MFRNVPLRIRRDISYKVITLIALVICALHLITLSPYFDDEGEDSSIQEGIPATGTLIEEPIVLSRYERSKSYFINIMIHFINIMI